MSTNNAFMEAFEKAVIDSTLLTPNGKLNDAQASRFINFVFDETVLKDKVRKVKFRNDRLAIEKIATPKRVAMAAEEATDPGRRIGVKHEKVLLNPQEIIVPLEISDDYKEENLEGDRVVDTIMMIIASQLANNLEEKMIVGNSTGGGAAAVVDDILDDGNTAQVMLDKFMGQYNGWLRLADGGNIYDAEDSNDIAEIAYQALTTMPTKFRKNKRLLKWMLPDDIDLLIDENARRERQTQLGDQGHTGGVPRTLKGVERWSVPLMPTRPTYVEEVTLNGTTAVPLTYKPILATEVIVTDDDLGTTATTPYIDTTDYVIDEANGTIARNGAGAIGDGNTVKVTYQAAPQMLLTWANNLVMGIGRDIRMEKDRDPMKRVDIIVVTMKVAVQFEELAGVVKVINMKNEPITP